MSFAEETYVNPEPYAQREGIEAPRRWSRISAPRWWGASSGWAARLAPGLLPAVAIAVAATVAGKFAPVVGAPVIAIVGGILIATVRQPTAAMRPGMMFASKKVLQGSIILLGSGLSLGEVVAAGGSSLPVTIGTLTLGLGMAALAGRALGLPRDLRTLIGVGTGICGASAIAATDAVINAEEADVSYAIATIFTFNVIAVLLYPTIGHAIGLSQHSFGMWAGTAINDVSSVVAAGTVYGHAAASYGVIVKLTRTLAIIPITLALALTRQRAAAGRPDAGAEPGGRPRPFSLRRVFPIFIVAFVGVVAVNSAGVIPTNWHHDLGLAAAFMITTALAAIGLSTNFAQIRRAGLRPLGLGAILWATVGLASLGLQAATGTL